MAIAFFHKLVFDLLILIIVVAIWRVLTYKGPLMKCLNSLPCPFSLLFQWYSLLILGFSGVFLQSIGNIILSDYIDYNFLDPDLIIDNLNDLIDNGQLTHKGAEDLVMPSWLRYVSLAAPVFGMAAFIVVANHLFMIIKQGYQRRKAAGHKYFWVIHGRQAMYIIVVAVPLVFLSMAVRSTSRMWMIMTGYSYGEDTVTNLALFKENFELAAICQYYTVFVFAQLCLSFLREQSATEEIKHAMGLVGFQGAYAWCIIGTVHSVMTFVISYMHNFGSLTPEAQAKYDSAEGKVSVLASAFSLLATYNMLMICKLKSVNVGLPGAGIKFNGTKVLLLLGPNQLKVLAKLSFLALSHECTLLLHSSLITIEMLAVVLLNFISWEVIGKSDALLKEEEEEGYVQLKG